MIDFKKTIINLHKAFPDKDFDELMKIIECIEESSIFETWTVGSDMPIKIMY